MQQLQPCHIQKSFRTHKIYNLSYDQNTIECVFIWFENEEK